MPLRTLLSRPSTGAPHRRHSSIVEDVPRSQDGTLPSDPSRNNVLQRLSLGLSGTNEEIFNPFPTHETEELQSHKSSMEADNEMSQPERPMSARAPDAMPSSLITDEPQPEKTLDGGLDDFLLAKPQRFSLLGFRHASDPQLSTRFKREDLAARTGTGVAPPKIITTAPTSQDFDDAPQRRSKRRLFARAPSPSRKGSALKDTTEGSPQDPVSEDAPRDDRPISKAGLSQKTSSFERLPRRTTHHGPIPPPAYGDESSSSLAIPVTRLSDSSRSDDSSGDHHVYAKTTTTHTISYTTTFFKLKRRKKNKGPLFPLPEKFATPSSGRTSTSYTPLESASQRKSMSPSRKSNATVRFDAEPNRQGAPEPSPTHSASALTNAPFGFPGPTMVRQDSSWSTHSGQSTPSVTLIPPRAGARGRSSTMSSLGRSAEKLLDPVPQPGSARTSISTSGRRSFGDLLTLPHRLRQNSAPPTRHGATASPGTPGSKSNSLQIPRDAEPERVYPRREEGDTPATYLEKLEAAVPRGSMATILCKSADDFSRTCLRKYMRGFSYFGDSIDMAIRKMLMEVELPKETQQIDRLLAGFADRYYECNPGIFSSTDEAAFVAFSILLLHSDTHNKNNKRKMQKQDYVKNTRQGSVQVSGDILDCFYDNVCYTPFIHFEDEVAINSHRLAAPKLKKSLIKTRSLESLRGPVDPYSLILDSKLDILRPSLKDVMETEDCYSSTGTAGMLETKDVHRAFVNSAVLQIVSARSRPDAFLSQATITNPGEAQAGLVSIKVAKVGLLWRKDPKKKKAKRPWQEWGAILTDSKLYFFKDVSWVKKLIAQYDAHSKATNKSGSLIFKPPLSSFEPDALMAMDDAVALMDSSYKKHKNAFVFIKHGGLEEIFLANSESEMNDWIGRLNYAATFRTAGIRMRGLLGSSYEGRHLVRKDSDFSNSHGEAHQKDRRIDPHIAWEIMFYRRQLINEKISDFDEKIAVAQKELDNLLRNARHLLVLLPIQQKTREQLVLAAGRMAAKLKWTRVELWRNRTHRDILAHDLEQEGATAFPVPRTSSTSTPQKTTPLKTGQAILGRTITDTSHLNLSPVSATPSPPSNLIDRLKGSENESARTEHSTVSLPFTASPAPSAEVPLAKRESNQDSLSLVHQASVTSSHHSRDKDARSPVIDNPEERILREAGLAGVEGAVTRDKRPDTSESEKDRVGAIAATNDAGKSGSVRRSLHRSLREGHLRDGLHHHHHSPSIHRHKKARESGSSVAATDDGVKSLHSEAEELRRGTGSFIVHGKKASVITMSTEWQSMSNEDRLKLRKAVQEEDAQDKLAITRNDDDTVDTASSFLTQTDDHRGSATSSRKPSFATTAGEQFVDAETGDDRGTEGRDEDNRGT